MVTDNGIDWAAAQDAYGSASAVPGLLRRAAADPNNAEVWQDLWSRLCHQGTVYEASFLAIPALAAMSRSAAPTAHSQPLNLLAGIAGSSDVRGTADTRAGYAEALTSCLPAAEAYAAAAADDADFCYALSVVAGLRGKRVWHEVLTFVADGDALGGCPVCGVDICVFLDTNPARVSLSFFQPPDGPEIVLAKAQVAPFIRDDALEDLFRDCVGSDGVMPKHSELHRFEHDILCEYRCVPVARFGQADHAGLESDQARVSSAVYLVLRISHSEF